MIIYEVNLQVEKTVWPAFITWLDEHIYGEKGMLSFAGFERVTLLRPLEEESHFHSLTVHYYVGSQTYLDDYFQHYAAAMREEGILRFGHQFSATRRILAEKATLSDCL